MGTKSNPSQFDCYHLAAPDEPIFILLGRDINAPAAVRKWASDRAAAIHNGFKPASHFDKIREAFDIATAMEDYYRQHVHHPPQRSADNPFRSINRRLDGLDEQNEKIIRFLFKALTMLQSLINTENREMATLTEVQADIDALKTEAASNGDTAQSAVTLIRRLIDMIGNAAASATDLDGLKASLESITTTVHASAQDLGDAVAAAPNP